MLSHNDNVLVTGGTGFTGQFLVKKLCSLGCNVSVIARPTSNRSALGDLPITWHLGDVYDESLIKNAADGVNYIFHVAACYREPKASDEVYRKVHIDSTKLLANAAIENKLFKRFVHISTVGVHGHVKNPPANENSEFNPSDIYQDTKLEAELWIRNFSENTQLPLTVIRPALIYGPQDSRTFKIFKLARLPIVPILGLGNGWLHFIHVDDLTDFMIHVANREDTLGEVIICGNTEPITFKDTVKILNKAMNKRSPFVRIPAWPFFMLGSICEKIFLPLNINPPIFRRRVAFFINDRSFDTKKMQSIDFLPKWNNAEGLRQTLQWYRSNGWLN